MGWFQLKHAPCSAIVAQRLEPTHHWNRPSTQTPYKAVSECNRNSSFDDYGLRIPNAVGRIIVILLEMGVAGLADPRPPLEAFGQ